jgi:hypothetical protein
VANLKKQSQFLEGQNERKDSYKKGIREIKWIGYLVKTNPISRCLIGRGLDSRLRGNDKYGIPVRRNIITLFEKTKPI